MAGLISFCMYCREQFFSYDITHWEKLIKAEMS